MNEQEAMEFVKQLKTRLEPAHTELGSRLAMAYISCRMGNTLATTERNNKEDKFEVGLYWMLLSLLIQSTADHGPNEAAMVQFVLDLHPELVEPITPGKVLGFDRPNQ